MLSEDVRLVHVIMDSMNLSGGEVRRLVAQGAIKINNETATDINQLLAEGDFLRVGKHKFLNIAAKLWRSPTIQLHELDQKTRIY